MSQESPSNLLPISSPLPTIVTLQSIIMIVLTNDRHLREAPFVLARMTAPTQHKPPPCLHTPFVNHNPVILSDSCNKPFNTTQPITNYSADLSISLPTDTIPHPTTNLSFPQSTSRSIHPISDSKQDGILVTPYFPQELAGHYKYTQDLIALDSYQPTSKNYKPPPVELCSIVTPLQPAAWAEELTSSNAWQTASQLSNQRDEVWVQDRL